MEATEQRSVDSRHEHTVLLGPRLTPADTKERESQGACMMLFMQDMFVQYRSEITITGRMHDAKLEPKIATSR